MDTESCRVVVDKVAVGRLANKLALVTSDGSGLGAAVAHAFAAAGAQVLCRDIAQPNRSNPVEIDIRELLDRASLEFGRVDIVVNVIALESPPPLHERSTHEGLEMDASALHEATRCGAARLANTYGGSILNIVRIGSTAAGSLSSAWGVALQFDELTQVAAKEYGPRGVRVNGISIIENETCRNGDMHSGAHAIPARSEYANRDRSVVAAALFLSSDESSATTGYVLPIDAPGLRTHRAVLTPV